MEERTCATCGYLGMRERNTREICEAEAPLRNKAEPPREGVRNAGWTGKAFEHTPICLMQIEPFFKCDHTAGSPQDTPLSAATQSDRHELAWILHKSRSDCPEWTKWTQGFTPKEHLEMNILQEQRDWQRKCEIENRVWRTEQADREKEARQVQAINERNWRKQDVSQARDWRLEDEQNANRRHRRELTMMLAAALIGGVAAIYAVRLTPPAPPPAINVQPTQPVIIQQPAAQPIQISRPPEPSE